MTSASIVLLHGQPSAGVNLWPLRSALRARLGPTVEIIAPDRPGYGANPRRVTDFTGNAAWLAELMRDRRDAPVFVLGHSWAGGAAVLAAARGPQSVAGLILLASIGPRCLLRSDHALAAPVLGDAAAFAALKLARPLIVRSLASQTLDALNDEDRVYAATSILASQRRPLWRSFLAEQRTLITQLPMIDAALPEVAAPALVISGSDDTVIPAVTYRELLARLPLATAALLPQAGHDLHTRRAAEVADHIARFVRQRLGHLDRADTLAAP